MIDFQKTIFDNSYNAITVIQDHNEKMMYGFLKQLPWVADENKKPLEDSISFIKKARAEYKKNVDQGFLKLQEFVDIKQEKYEGKKEEKAGSNAGAAVNVQPAPAAPKTKQAVKG